MRNVTPRKFDGVLFTAERYDGGITLSSTNVIRTCYVDGLRVRDGDKMVPYDGSPNVTPMWVIRGTMHGTSSALKILTDGEIWYKIDYIEDLRNDDDMVLTAHDQNLVQTAIGLYHGAKITDA